MKRSARFLALRTTAWRSIAPIAALLPTPCSGLIEPLRNCGVWGLSVVTPRLQTKRSFVVPAQAGIQVRFSGSSKVPGFPKFTNQVQHFLDKVLQWDSSMNNFRWKSAARFPDLAMPGKQSAKSRQLWIARHRL